MIVTCDHCGARYKLDDSRISGRGAKITCPRCRHIFVVYKDGGTGDAPETADDAADIASAPTEAPTEAPPSLDVHGLDFRKVGIPSWKVKVKIGLVYDFSDYKTLAKYIQDGRVTSSDLLSHNGSDWTAIGDIDDLPQHFVQVYLDAETAQAQAEADAQAEAEAVQDFEDDDEPTNIMGMDNLADAIGSEQAAQVAGNAAAVQLGGAGSRGPNLAGNVEELFQTATAAEDAGPRFVDPFEQRKKARQAKRNSGGGSNTNSTRPKGNRTPSAPTKESGSGGSGLLLAGLFAIVLVGGGIWWSQQPGASDGPTATVAPSPQPPPAQKAPSTPSPAPGPRTADDTILPADLGDPVNGDEPNGTWYDDEEEPQLRPVVPEWARQGKAPPGATPASASRAPAANPPPSAAPPSGGGDVQYSTLSATDHYQAGRAAMGRGRYAEAAQAFGQAHKLSPGNAAYEGAYGAALFRSGDTGGARGHLEQAAQQGHNPSLVYLGDIASTQGDVAGAIGYYRQYLATNPRDAGRVQEKIDRLNGA